MTIKYENTPELQAVVQHQQAVEVAQAVIQHLEQTIADQQQKADALKERAAELKALETQREDLLADIATGVDKSDELKTLEAHLSKNKQELHEQGTHSAIDQTVAGLRRKLEQARHEFAQLNSKSSNLMRAMLFAQAERIGLEYVDAAKQLKELFRRISAIRHLLERQEATVHHWTRNPLNIPMFPLESMLGESMKLLDKERGFLFVSEATSAELMPFVTKEKEALLQVGVQWHSAE